MAAALLVSTPSAWAGASFGIAPSIPANVTVGQTGIATSLTIRNISFNGAGETNFDTDSFQVNDITLVPSCGSPDVSPDCPVVFHDPGVIVPSPLTGAGDAGTACAGLTFTISEIDGAQGKYRFTPSDTIILGPSGGPSGAATCPIRFTSTISKMPTIDSIPAPGIQTDQKAFVATEVITVGSPNFGLTAAGIGTTRTTVNPATRATPVLSTEASGPVAVGGGLLTDTASITQLVNPVTTGAGAGTVEFRLYGPDDATCATAATFTSSSRPLTFTASTAASATSAAFAPTLPGVYRWRALFSGDANNDPVTGPCNAVNESVLVSPAPPPPPPPPPSARDPLLLRCDGVAVRLVDVSVAGRRVRLAGLASRRYSGQRVFLRAGHTKVATAIVQRDGTFATTAPAPRRATDPKYSATVAGQTSAALHLQRRLLLDTRVIARGGVRISGHLQGTRRARRELIVRRVTSCTSRPAITARLKTDRHGRFKLTLAAPTGSDDLAFYRVTTATGGRTYTLPIVVRR